MVGGGKGCGREFSPIPKLKNPYGSRRLDQTWRPLGIFMNSSNSGFLIHATHGGLWETSSIPVNPEISPAKVFVGEP